jgi:UDP-N-acetylmuramoylalanine--D-glutamate ligase
MTDFSVRGSNVVVVGAARSGVAAARLLAERGAKVTLSECRPAVDVEVERLQEVGVELELDGHKSVTLARTDLVVMSPGVPPNLPALDGARRNGVPVISEIELASRWVRGQLIAVTGTKGKSTTTVLLGRMLEAGGLRVLVGGNVGTALSTQVEDSTPETFHVVEVSSFQLELTTTFRPWIAVFLNLHSDHLDRHTSHADYAAAKARVFANQETSDTLVVNADDPDVLSLTRTSRAQSVVYALDTSLDEGVVVSGGAVVRRTRSGDESLVPLSAVHLVGRHLLSDVLAASAVANLVGVAAADMTRAVDRFVGLEHAFESVGEIGGVRFINDSKATNVEAVRRAVESCGDHLVVVMGGRFKGGALETLAPLLGARADAVVALGEARVRIREMFGAIVSVVEVVSMADAVRVAYGLASPGGTVLLAPACSSLDMFTDYSERGRVFKQAVVSLREDVEGKREQ